MAAKEKKQCVSHLISSREVSGYFCPYCYGLSGTVATRAEEPSCFNGDAEITVASASTVSDLLTEYLIPTPNDSLGGITGGSDGCYLV
jgi:hypothetical protein